MCIRDRAKTSWPGAMFTAISSPSRQYDEICRMAGPERPRWVKSSASAKRVLPHETSASTATPERPSRRSRSSGPKVKGTRAGRAGTTVTVGLPHPNARLDIQAVSLTVDERVLRGSYMGSAIPARDIPRFIAMYQAGLLPVDRLLSHTLKLEDINEAFDVLDRGEAVRQVVVFD